MYMYFRCEGGDRDLWSNLEWNWQHFYCLTGKIPDTLNVLVNQLRLNFPQRIRRRGQNQCLSFRNQVLLTMIWMWKYSKLCHLSMHFIISTSSVHLTIQRNLPILHAYLVPKYMWWHSMQYWTSLAGDFPQWPRAVGILDCTPFRINRPRGKIYLYGMK